MKANAHKMKTTEGLRATLFNIMSSTTRGRSQNAFDNSPRQPMPSPFLSQTSIKKHKGQLLPLFLQIPHEYASDFSPKNRQPHNLRADYVSRPKLWLLIWLCSKNTGELWIWNHSPLRTRQISYVSIPAGPRWKINK